MSRRIKHINLKDVLEQYGEKAMEAAAAVMRESADQLVAGAKARAPAESGKLRDSIRKLEHGSGKRYTVAMVCDAKSTVPVKHPGVRNPNAASRYKNTGVPYGRIIEFSPKYNHPFFFTDYYNQRAATREKVIEAIHKAVSEP